MMNDREHRREGSDDHEKWLMFTARGFRSRPALQSELVWDSTFSPGRTFQQTVHDHSFAGGQALAYPPACRR